MKCCEELSKRLEKLRFFGILLSFIAGFFLAVSGLFSNFLGTNRSQTVLVQFVLSYMCSLVTLTWKKVDTVATPNRTFALVIGFSSFSTVSTLTFFLAFKYLPMGDVFAIYNSFVVFVQILSCVFLKENCQASDVIFTIVSVAGVICVAQPDFLFLSSSATVHQHTNRPTGIILAIVSNLTTCGTILCARAVNQRANAHLLLFYRGLVGSLGIGIAMYFIEGGYHLPCLREIGLMLLSGFFGHANLLLRTIALQFERAGPVSVAYTGQIGFAFLFDYFVLNYAMNYICVIGALAIFISSVGIFLKTYFANISFSRVKRR